MAMRRGPGSVIHLSARHSKLVLDHQSDPSTAIRLKMKRNVRFPQLFREVPLDKVKPVGVQTRRVDSFHRTVQGSTAVLLDTSKLAEKMPGEFAAGGERFLLLGVRRNRKRTVTKLNREPGISVVRHVVSLDGLGGNVGHPYPLSRTNYSVDMTYAGFLAASRAAALKYAQMHRTERNEYNRGYGKTIDWKKKHSAYLSEPRARALHLIGRRIATRSSSIKIIDSVLSKRPLLAKEGGQLALKKFINDLLSQPKMRDRDVVRPAVVGLLGRIVQPSTNGARAEAMAELINLQERLQRENAALQSRRKRLYKRPPKQAK